MIVHTLDFTGKTVSLTDLILIEQIIINTGVVTDFEFIHYENDTIFIYGSGINDTAPLNDIVTNHTTVPVEVEDNSSLLEKEYFVGRIYIRKKRWYGCNIIAGAGYYSLNYNYKSSLYSIPPTPIDYNKLTGQEVPVDGILRKMRLQFPRSSSLIDDMRICIVKVTKGTGSANTQTVIYHDNGGDGTRIEVDQFYDLYFNIDEPVSEGEIICVFFNSDASSSSNKYLYDAKINLIYEQQ